MKPGITFQNNGTAFAVHSTAKQMTLLLFDKPEAETPSREIAMTRNQKSKVRGQESIFHVHIPEARAGQFYLYKNEKSQWLLDPCARALHASRKWGERPEVGGRKTEISDQKSEVRNLKLENGNSKLEHPASRIPNPLTFPKCVVVDDSFDWEDDAPPNTPLNETIIYEAHLRGFTKNDSGGGSYLDFIEKIPYLKELGITAVEFLPLFEFNELEFFLRGDARKDLLNFWGYSTLGFFAPMSRFAKSSEPGAAVSEFKTLVKALHAAGIEVILDVVFNHTGEGEKQDITYHFQALDEEAYYLKNPDGSYQNWTGCGNTVNANHPVTRQFIVECLKYWVTDMHVDGFRFDLATSLCRGEDGELLDKPPLIKAIEAAPDLKKTKLIAEAWDLGGYQVGHFPGKRFCDWNGKYRDDIRRFWNRNHAVGNLATRLAGSSDLYGHKDSGPLHSINFITSHDGFTLADLVSYADKHNEVNGENNRDGENHDESVNFDVEGPTDDPSINARRLLQQKNLLATLFLSQGVPMLTAGDEFGRTQQGNNNAYCQDNDISWIDWSLLEQNRELFEFTKQLIALRNAHPALRRTKHFPDQEVKWLAPEGGDPDWQNARALGMNFGDLLILINNEDQATGFSTHWERGAQAITPAKTASTFSTDWKLELATAETSNFTLPPHSLAVYTKST